MSRAKKQIDLSHLVNEPAQPTPPRVVYQEDGYRIVRLAMNGGQRPRFAFERQHGTDALGNPLWWPATEDDYEARAWLLDMVGTCLEGRA